MSLSGRNPLLLPEILRLIGPLLTRNQLLICLRVCSTWNSALNPLLWSNVPLPQRWKISKNPEICPSTETLHRNANHILELVCSDLFLVDQLIPGCCRLEKLVMQCLGPQVGLLLLQSQKSLKEVHLRRDSFQDSGEVTTEEIIKALQTCENLECLVLTDFEIKPRDDRKGATEPNVAQDFYSFLKRVPRLKLYNSNFMEPPEPVLKVEDGAVGDYVPMVQIDPITTQSFPISPYASLLFEPSLPGLESLVLFGSRMNLLDQLKLLHHCDQLKSLSWMISGFTSPINNLGADMHFRFHKLILLDLCWTQLTDTEIAALLTRTPNITHLKLKRTQIGRHTIEQIVGQGVLEENDVANFQVLEAAPIVPGEPVGVGHRGLRDKLVSLNISDCPLVTSRQVRSILWHCSELRDLRAPLVSAGDLFDSAPAVNDDPVAAAAGNVEATDWACTKLEMLQINIVDIPELPRIQEQQRAILAQIGRLHRLRALSVECATPNMQSLSRVKKTSLQFSLPSGLDELANLSLLRSFHFGPVAHLMGADEYEWMSRHWPALCELGQTLGPPVHYEDEALEIKNFVGQLMPNVSFVRQANSSTWSRGRDERGEDMDEDEDED